MIQSFK